MHLSTYSLIFGEFPLSSTKENVLLAFLLLTLLDIGKGRENTLRLNSVLVNGIN